MPWDDFSSGFNFKLTEFEVKCSIELSYQNDFLMKQTDSLETLSIDIKLNDDVIKTVLSMPRLKSLALRNVDSYSFEYVDSNDLQNQSVTSLELTFQSPMAELDLILWAFPNIQSLKLYNINNFSADIISSTCSCLKRLSAEYFSATEIIDEGYFSKLEMFISGICEGSQQLYERICKK